MGIGTSNRKVEHESRTGPDKLLQKKREKGVFKSKKQSLNSQIKIRSSSESVQLKNDGRNNPSKGTNSAAGHEKFDLFLLRKSKS